MQYKNLINDIGENPCKIHMQIEKELTLTFNATKRVHDNKIQR